MRHPRFTGSAKFWPVPLLLLALAAGCERMIAQADGDHKTQPLQGVKARLLTDSGGRVSWYKGAAHELIAYDAIVSRRPYRIETFLIEPDGSNKRCFTCDLGIPGAIKGQPAWHPDGKHLLLQIINENADVTSFNHMSWGFNNDLWLISLDGKRKERIWKTPENHAALHPHFDKDGDTLIFSERQATGKSRWILRNRTPGGERPWDGWRIHVADVNLSRSGEAILGNHREIQPNGDGFYETHGFTPNGRITFSYTNPRGGYVDDSYESTLEGKNVRNLTNDRNAWDEHGMFSPNGQHMVFISSRIDPSLVFPKTPATKLKTELYIQTKDGGIRQLTNMNDRRGKLTVVSDFSWDRDSKRLALQVAPWERPGLTPEIWIIELP